MDYATLGEKSAWPKRQFLIDRQFQLKFIFILVVISLWIALICGGLLYYTLNSIHDKLQLPPQVREQLGHMDITLLSVFAVTTALFTISSGYFGLRMSHKWSGPEFVMTKYLAELTEDHYPEGRSLRKGDEFKDFFMLMQNVIESKRANEVEEAYRIQQALDLLAPLASTEDAKQAIASLKAMGEKKKAATLREFSKNS